ncbi:MAG: hypothetical protein NVSMB63_18460 [Sediminibacterium sp.]
MNLYKGASFLWIGIVISLNGPAQKLDGNWYGVGYVQAAGEHDSYLSELVLKQKGKAVTGIFRYYFRDSLFAAPLTGSFDTQTRKVKINPLPVIYHGSASTKNGIDCMMSGNFLLRISRTGSILSGSFMSDAAHRFLVPDLNVNFRFSSDTAALVLKNTEDTAPDSISVAAIEKHPEEKYPAFLKRNKVYIKELDIASPTIQVELYDNGVIDYDSVTLFLNNKMVLPKSMLRHKAIKLNLILDPTLDFNELSMFADNLGMVPPNTAAMIVYDGKKKYEVIMTSDLDQTATIKLKHRFLLK